MASVASSRATSIKDETPHWMRAARTSGTTSPAWQISSRLSRRIARLARVRWVWGRVKGLEAPHRQRNRMIGMIGEVMHWEVIETRGDDRALGVPVFEGIYIHCPYHEELSPSFDETCRDALVLMCLPDVECSIDPCSSELRQCTQLVVCSFTRLLMQNYGPARTCRLRCGVHSPPFGPCLIAARPCKRPCNAIERTGIFFLIFIFYQIFIRSFSSPFSTT